MENASNALILAAGILIGILVLSIAVYSFVDFGSTSAEIHSQIDEQRLIEFNTRFTSYISTQENGEWKRLSTIHDIVTIAGYARENNNYYLDEKTSKVEDGYEISIYIKGWDQVLQTDNIAKYNKTNDFYNELISKDSKDSYRFKCTEGNIKYYDSNDKNNTGRVKSMTFEKVN